MSLLLDAFVICRNTKQSRRHSLWQDIGSVDPGGAEEAQELESAVLAALGLLGFGLCVERAPFSEAWLAARA